MDNLTNRLTELHQTLNLPVQDPTTLTDSFKVNMFLNSIRNEFEDLATEIQGIHTEMVPDSTVTVANALARLIYSAYSFGLSFNANISQELDIIHQVNMQRANRLKTEGFFDGV